ncbi:Hypothetical protein SMAX5B_015820 [Scophthalmus maximus]|uniref:Uncharacterized protein n=1 Tax=Scophthalmus maximus TaxID=52904 RepID=A0A2U9D0U5_SCOMX|nr:Hypothetical protein SMAX5B_015820 [Scophthalmus maximus]
MGSRSDQTTKKPCSSRSPTGGGHACVQDKGKKKRRVEFGDGGQLPAAAKSS